MSATATPIPTVLGRRTPRILRSADPASTNWAAALDRASALGFDTLLLPHSSVPAGLVQGAAGLGVALMCDVQLDQAPPGWNHGGPFRRLPSPTLDPREPMTMAETAIASVATLADIAGLAEVWSAEINRLQAAGISGVRLLGLADLPAWGVVGLVTALRTACPSMVLFGSTLGLPWPVLQALPPQSLDLVSLSLPFWDGHSDWLWTELELLRRVAPVVAEAGGHPDRAAFAAVVAEGWMSTGEVADAETFNRIRSTALAGLPWSRLVSAPGAALALLRTDSPDPRQSHRAALALTAISPAAPLDAGVLLAAAEGAFGAFMPVLGAGEASLTPSTRLSLRPGSLSVYAASGRSKPVVSPLSRKAAETAATRPRLAIEAPSPCVDGGRFPARQVVGSEVVVEADIIGDGHDHLAAALRWRGPGETEWSEVRMTHVVNDRWTARFPLTRMGMHHYSVEAWKDVYDTFVDELEKKHAAGVPITLEVQEGGVLVRAALERSKRGNRSALAAVVKVLEKGDLDAKRQILLAASTQEAMARADDRVHRVSIEPIPVQAERSGAAFASWYEVFPRSMSDDETRHGTFRDVQRHLPRIEAMGFDVLYFPPIHPIGLKNRKGRNNTLTPTPEDVGSPYAIGSIDGGHDAIHPELGSIEDFQHLRAAAAEHGIELALDFAIQCSPDHPWLEQHKNWFTWRPDGTIRYAENPPKKYQDIVNVDFYAPGAVPDLWIALCDAVLYWAGQGVRLFRVDNPHTKSLPFWEWMIAEVQARYPDSVFLAEAFTRPKVMYRLAKVGFSQSYTYFTWRSTPWEFREYMTDLTQGPARDFFRPHFFVNTPDINPVPLQTCPRSGFLSRAALAATLSGLWGVYNGFELCDATPVPGKEEYLDSEKYQIRAWDWQRPGNIVAEIAQLNAIRKRNPALHTHLGVTFLDCDNNQVLAFEKATPDRSNVLLVVINTNLWDPQGATVSVPFWRWPTEPGTLIADDLVTDRRETWSDRRRSFVLTSAQPYAIWRLTPSEGDA